MIGEKIMVIGNKMNVNIFFFLQEIEINRMDKKYNKILFNLFNKV